jgi:DNA-binding beta-propeller fold protein YncE
MPYSIDLDKDHRDTYVYSGGFDRKVQVILPKKNKIARSINLDKEYLKASDEYMKV